PLRDDGPDDRAVHSRFEAADRRDRGRVLVAVRDVIEKVARRDDSQTTQRFGSRRPDALKIRDRCVQEELLGPRQGTLSHSRNRAWTPRPTLRSALLWQTPAPRMARDRPLPRPCRGTSPEH